uniref:Bestrophin homolog n=2 Tax=Steinernema glaseri TaxID=37863 RepID=A0A1I7XW61_9BILA
MSKQPHIKPDFDTDVLWRPPRMSSHLAGQRTASTESSDDSERRASVSSIGEQRRRFSITEMLFGSSPPAAGSMPYQQHGAAEGQAEGKTQSVTKDPRFKEILKHQRTILGDSDQF